MLKTIGPKLLGEWGYNKDGFFKNELSEKLSTAQSQGLATVIRILRLLVFKHSTG